MAQVRQYNVQIKLEIDGSQSKTEPNNLTRKAQPLQTGLKKMKRRTGEYIAPNKELREVNARIKELRDDIGLTGLTIDQPGPEAVINKGKEITEVDTRLADVRTQAKGVLDGFKNAGSGGVGDFIKHGRYRRGGAENGADLTAHTPAHGPGRRLKDAFNFGRS